MSQWEVTAKMNMRVRAFDKMHDKAVYSIWCERGTEPGPFVKKTRHLLCIREYWRWVKYG